MKRTKKIFVLLVSVVLMQTYFNAGYAQVTPPQNVIKPTTDGDGGIPNDTPTLQTPLKVVVSSVSLTSPKGISLGLPEIRSDVENHIISMFGTPTKVVDYLYMPQDLKCKIYSFSNTELIVSNNKILMFDINSSGFQLEIGDAKLEVGQPVSALTTEYPQYKTAILNSTVAIQITTKTGLYAYESIYIDFNPVSKLVTRIVLLLED